MGGAEHKVSSKVWHDLERPDDTIGHESIEGSSARKKTIGRGLDEGCHSIQGTRGGARDRGAKDVPGLAWD